MNDNRILFLALALLLGGCGTTTPVALDSHMGQTVDMALAQQTLNPEAMLDTRPVDKIDGPTASAVVDRYHASFKKPTAINIFSLGVTGGGGSTLGPAVSGGK